MNKNVIQFIVDENGDYLNNSIPVGRVKATSNLTTRIQLVTPISASVAVNYVIYDSKDIQKKQYLIPTADLGSEVVDPNNPDYQEVAGWNVYEADIYAPILSVISRFRTGKVGMSFEFVEQVPNALCKNHSGYFGVPRELPETESNFEVTDLPETANDGDYYICADYNFRLNDKLYNKGDILVWYNEKWHNGGLIPRGSTETVDISVDPSISYPTEDVDDTAFETVFGTIAEDVAELDTRLKGVETDLNRKQDEVDEFETTAKTVVGAINELNSGVNTLDGQVATLQVNYADTHNKAEQALNKSVEANSKSDEAINTANEAHTIAIGASRAIALNDEAELLAYISDQTNKANVGDAIYLKQTDMPDYWITEVLDIPNASGYYYEIEPLESKLPDITNMVTTDTEQTITESKNFTGGLKKNGVDVAVVTDITTTQQAIDNLQNEVSTKQDELVSGVNIKTINNTSLLGSGNIEISGGGPFLKDPAKTYLVIKTPTDNDTFTLLTGTDGSPDYIIEWGDGESENVTTTDNPSHEYAKAGMYLITISWSFTNGIVFGYDANVNKNKIIEVYGGSNYPTSIGGQAFHNCRNLTTAHFTKVTSIGNAAFRDCVSLTTANFPNATSVDSGAFGRCTNLTTASFPHVTSIDGDAFRNCPNLTTANFPKVTSVSYGTFQDCQNLTTANFPKVTSMGNVVFENCTSLKELTLGNVTTTTATGGRFRNVKLVNLTIAEEVTEADITRIKQFYADNGGTFIGTETKNGLQVEKTPTADNDVVRKVDIDNLIGDIDLILDNINGEVI